MAAHYVVRSVDRAPPEVIAALRDAGVATAHEAAGRVGLLGPAIQARQTGVAIAGSAITVSCHPGDNLMLHAAMEVCQPGDVLVVTTTSPSTDGMFGELFATALQHRGARGLVINAGVRDVAELHEMGFPVWSAAVSAQGTVKATPGSVNVPVSVAGQMIHPGDAILADDDGVLCVPRDEVSKALAAADARAAKEKASRAAFRRGELGLDRYGLRDKLAGLGIEYVEYEKYIGT